MQEISREEFYNNNMDQMAGVSADERELYRIDENTRGVIATHREDEIRIRGIVLRRSNENFRIEESKTDSTRNEEGAERSREKIENWLQNQ